MNRFLQYQMLVAVVEEGSLSAAARKLNVTPSAISKQLVGLEESLGLQLVERTNRSADPTATGTDLYYKAKEILALVSETENSLNARHRSFSGPLRITMPQALIRSPLYGAITRFCIEHPDIQLDLRIDDSPVDLYREKIDVALRFGHLGNSTRLVQSRLLTTKLVCVASPLYIERCGLPRSAAQLAQHRVMLPDPNQVSEDIRRTGRQFSALLDWTSASVSNHSEAIYQAVIDGMCIGFLLEISVQQELLEHKLVDLFPRLGLPAKHLYLMRKLNGHDSEMQQAFRQALLGNTH